MNNIKETKTKENFMQKEQNRIFKQCMKEFYTKNQEEQQAITQEGKIKIEPKLLYAENENKIKIEFYIGETQTYKIKNITEFYERMLNSETYKYGTKLEFRHNETAFKKEDRPLLTYLLKYAEIAKYANEALSGYSYYGKKLVESTIVLSNTALDELYEIMKNKTIAMEKRGQTQYITFSTQEKQIEYHILPEKENTYKMIPNIDVFAYEILKGKEYSYLLINDTLYRISKQEETTTLKLLEFYKKNYTKEIIFKNTDLAMVYSVLIAKMEKNIHVEKVKKEDKETYIPKPLNVKVYLDYNEQQYLTANLQFAYGKTEFNPLVARRNKPAKKHHKRKRSTLHVPKNRLPTRRPKPKAHPSRRRKNIQLPSRRNPNLHAKIRHTRNRKIQKTRNQTTPNGIPRRQNRKRTPKHRTRKHRHGL